MWDRDDIHKQARMARDKAIADGCQSKVELEATLMDNAITLALDNAASIAESYGRPDIEIAIDDHRDAYPLAK